MDNRITERNNFYHLVADIVWFGLALAATTRFLSVYAIRLGASDFEVGLLVALPGLVLLLSTMMTAWWRRRFSTSVQAVNLPGITFRLIFLLPAFAPLLPTDWQIPWLILSVTLPALPQGIAMSVFLVLMREAVPPGRMNALQSYRTSAMNMGLAASSLGFGLLLESVVFPLNYQLMFTAAFIFTIISHWHVMRVQVVFPTPAMPQVVRRVATLSGSIWSQMSFQTVAVITLTTYLSHFMLVAIIPLHLVNGLGASEGFIALFGLVELASAAAISSVADRLIARIGVRGLIGWSLGGLALAATTIALAPTLEITLWGAALTGAAWATATIGVMCFLMEHIASEDATRASVAWQQIVAVCTFIGPLIGGALASGGFDLPVVLLAGAALRVVAGLHAGMGMQNWRGRRRRVRV